MTRHKKENKFLEQKVIDEAAMLAYLNNELDAQEKQQFEKLLESDPFAVEALEGLQAAKNKPVITESRCYLNKKVRDRAGVSQKKMFAIHWTNYAWAAVILGLLIGVGAVMMIYMGRQNSGIAMEKEKITGDSVLFETKQQLKAPESSTVPSLDSMKPAQNALDTLKFSESSKESEPTKVVSTTEPTSNITASKSALNEKTTAATKLNPTVNKKTEALKTVAVPAADAAADKKAESQNKPAPSKTEKEEANKSPSNVSMDDAMKNFNSGNYKESSEMFEVILQKQPTNADALYFSGISEYINGNFKRSEKNFDKLLKDGTKYADGAKWYKANILLQNGKKDEAKKLLNELSQTGGSYKERAIKKKSELEF
jgi:hypothetical protein